MSIAFNGMPIGVTASSKIILLTNIIFRDNEPCSMLSIGPMGACSQIGTDRMQTIWRQDE